jgi:hypothetical protein
VSGLSLLILLAVEVGLVHAQEPDDKSKEETRLGWYNASDLSVVLTSGNADSVSLGFSNELRYVWKKARFQFDVNLVRSSASDDRFFVIAPGIEFPVGGSPPTPARTLVRPEPTLDAANSTVRASYERDISSRTFWNTGASWDRNEDAGILNRYIEHAGIGNKWVDDARRRIATSYGISYTQREEDKPDPDKDRRFVGARLGWSYTEHLNKGVTFDSVLAMNVNLSDAGDRSIDTTNALTVAVIGHVLIKVSLQWLIENEPALDTGLNVVAFVQVVNPDGIPGSGDERFRTVAAGGTQIVVGAADARKDRVDTNFRTALVIKF